MKKVLILLAFIPMSLFGQQTKRENVITAGAGYSLLGALLSFADGPGVETKVTPALLLSYDHGFSDYVSLGLAVGYQQSKSTYTDYAWTDANGTARLSNFDVNASRLNIGARTLFHYGDIDDLDLYSGIRLSFQSFNINNNSPDPDFNASFSNTGLFGVQLIAFGARGYVANNIGFNVELALGSPYLAMVGLNYRFGGEKED